MRRHLSFMLLAAGITGLATGCDDDDPSGPAPELFRATLNGANERPTARTTPATGVADLTFRNDLLSWSISMTTITNVTAAHIHTGGPEVSAGVILPLTPGTSGVNNTLITGSVTRAAYVPPAALPGVTFDSLLVLMRNGNSYVNVHTNNTANDPTNNSGPGDFPGGEIRGQIARR